MKQWLCKVCGYIHVGEAPPDICPVCGAGKEFFKEVSTEFSESSTTNQQELTEQRKNIQDVLFKVPCGLFIISSVSGEKINGMINNTLFQITDTPLQVVLGMDKRHLTTEFILASHIFTVNFLKPDQLVLVRQFGFKSGREIDKFANREWFSAETGAPVLKEVAGYLDCRIIPEKTVDAGTHFIFLAEVTMGKIDMDATILTYQEYRDRKNELWTGKNG